MSFVVVVTVFLRTRAPQDAGEENNNDDRNHQERRRNVHRKLLP